MSAIFGIIDFEGRPLEEKWIKSMQADLAHRGPDGQGLYREPSVALGHMLLQVTPESVYDKSPYEEDGFVITANARLDERESIMDRIGTPQSERDKITDPLLLLRSFKKFGKDFVKDIYGDFAFAIWDKNKRELFCARDQMGVKPFLYYHHNGRFVFSTETRAIMKILFVEKKLNQNRFYSAVLGFVDRSFETAWLNTNRLPASKSICLTASEKVMKRYWRPKYRPDKNLKSEEDSASELKRIITKIIKDQTRSIFNVGVPLSGGLDSSTIASITAELLKIYGKKLFTVSEIIDPDRKGPEVEDEINYIRAVINKLDNVDAQFTFHNEFKYLETLKLKFDKHYDMLTSAYYVDETLFESFNKKEVRRVLSGYLGDTTVSNSTIEPLAYLLINFKFLRLISHLKQRGKNCNYTKVVFLKRTLLELFPRLIPLLKHLLLGEKLPWSPKDLPLNLKPTEIREFKKSQKEIIYNKCLFPSDVSNKIYNDKYDLFEENWDCASSYYNLEITYPFLDRRIIEFLHTVPIEHFQARGISRGLIRLAMKNILPDNIISRRSKGSYSPNNYEIIIRFLNEFVKNIETKQMDEIFDLRFDLQKIKSTIRSFNNSNYSSSIHNNYWIFIYICIWITFLNWYNSLQIMNTKVNKRSWQKPFIKSSILIKNTLAKGGKGGDGSPNINQSRS